MHKRMLLTFTSASGIRDTGFIRIYDPYVRVKHGNVKAKSNVCKDGGTAPRWNQTIELKFNEKQTLELTIKNSNVLKDDVIGVATVDVDQLNEIQQKGEEGELLSLPVYTQERRQKGEIQIRIVITSENDRQPGSYSFSSPLDANFPPPQSQYPITPNIPPQQPYLQQSYSSYHPPPSAPYPPPAQPTQAGSPYQHPPQHLYYDVTQPSVQYPMQNSPYYQQGGNPNDVQCQQPFYDYGKIQYNQGQVPQYPSIGYSDQ